MAKMTRGDVTLTLSSDEFAAINIFLSEISRIEPRQFTMMMTENNLVMPINHAETLTKMWADLHS